jgi:putative transposase
MPLPRPIMLPEHRVKQQCPSAGQLRLDDFREGLEASIGGSAATVTRPSLRSTVQTSDPSGTAPSTLATPSGTVARKESDPSRTSWIEERNVPGIDSPITLIGGRLHNYSLSVGLPIADEYKYLRGHRLYVAYKRREREMSEAVVSMTPEQWWRAHAWTDQRTPALAIVARGDQIREIAPKTYSVLSQSRPETSHTVTEVSGGKSQCDCPFFAATSMTCIHILAVRYRNGLRESGPIPAQPSIACDRCKSSNVISKGIRHNVSGPIQRYSCKSCGCRFVGRDGFQKRRADPTNIARALDLYFRGMSIRKVREHLEQVERLNVSHMAVYRWIVHYSKLSAEWMDAQGARTSDRWHVDETVVNVNGKNEYLWNVLDHDTRFLLATHVSENRSLDNTRTPLRKAKGATPDRPVDVLTDGMLSYPVAIGKELGRKATALDDPTHVRGGRFNPHERVPSIRAKESNNRIERFHGTEKERFKVMRGFDGEPGTEVLAEGLRVHYNLVRNHQALGMTPGEAAGIPVGDGFRWKRIIEEASRSRRVTDKTQES